MTDRLPLPVSGLLMLMAALPIAAQAGDWRLARVQGIMTHAEVDTAVNVDCAPVRADRPDAPVMVVSYRVGKSRAWRAVDLRPQDAFAVGEEVRIDLARCRVEHRVDRVAPAASAP